jgi:kynureninase
VASPRDASKRGSHVSLRHPEGYRVVRALIDLANVLPDFRAPDRVRLGFAPVYARYVDVWDGLDRLRNLVASGAHLTHEAEALPVT